MLRGYLKSYPPSSSRKGRNLSKSIQAWWGRSKGRPQAEDKGVPRTENIKNILFQLGEAGSEIQ